METAEITRSIGEIRTLAEAGNVKVAEQLKSIETQTASLAARTLDLEQKILTRGAPFSGPTDPGMSLGKLVANDQKIQALLKGDVREINIPLAHSLKSINKAALTNAGQGAAGSTPYPVIPETVPGTPRSLRQRPLAFLDEMTTIPVSTAESVVPRLLSFVDGTAEQLKEGDLKGTVDLTFDTTPVRPRTIAGTATVSRQLLGDVPMLGTFIDTTMTYLTRKKLEAMTVVDLLAAAVPYAGTETAGADLIAGSLVQMEAAGYNPSVALLAPADFLKIFTERGTDGYIGPGWGAPQPGSLWGIRCLPSAALTVGTGLLIDLQTCAILDREAVNIQIGFSSDSFVRNLVVFLCELRASTAIFDAQGISLLTLPAAA